MKKEVKTQKMTIDRLGIIIAKGFASIEARMANKEDIQNLEQRLDAKIEGVKNRLEGTNKRIDDFAETKTTKIAHKEIENRVGFIEKKLEIKK